MPKLLLSKSEAAKALGISRNSTLEDLIRLKLLQTVKVNKRLKIPRFEVERLASQGFDTNGGISRHRPRLRSNAAGICFDPDQLK